MSAIKVNQVQIGQSSNANNNFTLNVPTAPDGTIKLNRGVPGSLGVAVLSIGSDNKVVFEPGPGIGDVTVSGAQTLTNKTVDLASNTLTGTIAQFNAALIDADFASIAGTETLSNKTLSNPLIVDGFREEIYTASVSGTISINAANGSIQVFTHTGAIAFTDELVAGQSLLLGLTPGTNTTTWPTITWAKVGGHGVAPELTSYGVNWIVLWKINSTLRGAFLGTA